MVGNGESRRTPTTPRRRGTACARSSGTDGCTSCSGSGWPSGSSAGGPWPAFNPDLHLPSEPTPERLAHLDQRMRDAEASHAILLVLTLGVVLNAALRGWWAAAGWTLLFDVLMNGYPVMLQRYNRARLSSRYDLPATDV